MNWTTSFLWWPPMYRHSGTNVCTAQPKGHQPRFRVAARRGDSSRRDSFGPG
jgi:hypothetical protein